MFVRATLMAIVVGMLHAADAIAATPRVAVAWTRVSDGIGFVQGLQGEAPWAPVTTALAVGGDPVLRSFQDTLYVLSRADGELALVDVQTWSIVRTHLLGPDSQPVDIAIVDHMFAYVTRASTTELLRMNLLDGTTEAVIDLASFGDTDGNPDMGTMALYDDRLFIQLRRLDGNGLPSVPLLAVMDLATEELIDVDTEEPGTQAIALQGTSPKGKMQVDAQARRLIVSATGSFHDLGGIEVLDPDTYASLGFAVDESSPNAGADTGAFVMTTSSFGYFSFSTDFAPSSHLHTFTFPAGVDFGPELQTTLLYIVPRILHDPQTNLLFWPEGGNVAPGVLVFDAGTGAKLTPQPIATTGNPTDLELLCVEGCVGVKVESRSWGGIKGLFRASGEKETLRK